MCDMSGDDRGDVRSSRRAGESDVGLLFVHLLVAFNYGTENLEQRNLDSYIIYY